MQPNCQSDVEIPSWWLCRATVDVADGSSQELKLMHTKQERDSEGHLASEQIVADEYKIRDGAEL